MTLNQTATTKFKIGDSVLVPASFARLVPDRKGVVGEVDGPDEKDRPNYMVEWEETPGLDNYEWFTADELESDAREVNSRSSLAV